MNVTTIEGLRTLVSAHTDYDGLVSQVFDEIDQDWVRVGQFWIRLDSRFPWQLSQCFSTHAELLPGLSLRLDLSAVEPVQAHERPLRKAYYWGGKFRWEDLDSYGGPIVTKHGDSNSLIQSLSYVSQVIFRWNRPRDQPIAVLQIEEFREGPEAPEGSYTTRYLHSILNRSKHEFFHLDGAVKTYTSEAYARAYAGQQVKSSKYEKLFRTDQAMAIGTEPWISCVASFFALDRLVMEYFDGA